MTGYTEVDSELTGNGWLMNEKTKEKDIDTYENDLVSVNNNNLLWIHVQKFYVINQI